VLLFYLSRMGVLYDERLVLSARVFQSDVHQTGFLNASLEASMLLFGLVTGTENS